MDQLEQYQYMHSLIPKDTCFTNINPYNKNKISDAITNKEPDYEWRKKLEEGWREHNELVDSMINGTFDKYLEKLKKEVEGREKKQTNN